MELKETKLHNLNKEIKKIHEDLRNELTNKQNKLHEDRKKYANETMNFSRHQEQHTKMMEKEKEEMKKEKEEMKKEKEEVKKEKEEMKREKKDMKKEKEEMKKEKEEIKKEKEEMKKERGAKTTRQKKFYNNMKKQFVADEKFWNSKHKYKRELDIEEREKKVSLMEEKQETLRCQLTNQMAIVNQKEGINEADIKRNNEQLSKEKQKISCAEVELKKEKKDVAQQRKKYDYMLLLLETKKVGTMVTFVFEYYQEYAMFKYIKFSVFALNCRFTAQLAGENT